MKRKNLSVRWSLLVLLVIFLTAWQVAAQDEETAVWQEPTNLSESGAATSPSMLIDSNGTFHLFWHDEFVGYTYTTGDGTNWGPQQILRMPFSIPAYTIPADGESFGGYYTPQMITDGGLIHAFWRDINGVLYYSRALASGVTGGSAAWTAPFPLKGAVINTAAAVDANGRLHLAYIRNFSSESEPAGIYHRVSADSGQSWSEPVLLYQSNYFRELTESDSGLNIDTAGNDVHIVWDNRGLDTVFIATSGDSGATWSEPTIVDRRQPEDPLDGAGPSHIDVKALGEDVHLSWWAGDARDEQSCIVWHRLSTDSGATWDDPQEVYKDSRNCPWKTDFVVGQDDFVLLVTLVRSEGYLQALYEGEWTEPESNTEMAKIINPQTVREVFLGCHETYVSDSNQLYVAACGSGRSTDVWMLQRPLGTVNDWFDLDQVRPAWDAPSSVVASSVYLLPGDVVAGADGRLHAFWSQTSDIVAARRIANVTTEVGPEIYYARLSDEQWGAARPIITSPRGKAEHIDSVAAPDGTLYLAWSSGKDGGVYISRAAAEQAPSETEWIDPVLLPAPQTTGSWPDILLDENGTLFVAYTIPLNEDRGIYLVQSEDRGNSWSEPIKVFDGEANGWQIVGRPRLARTEDGNVHLMWTRDLPSSNSTLALVYARSEDDGQTWSEPEIVTEDTVVWSDIVGIGTRTVHRAWQALSDNRVLLWHQVSFDNGLTWSQPVRVSDPTMDSGAADLVLGINQAPHLLQLGQTTDAKLYLLEWIWDVDGWQEGEPLEISDSSVSADSLSAVHMANGRLGVIYGSLIGDATAGTLQDSLFFTSRTLVGEDVAVTPLPTLTPTPSPTATAVVAATPQAEATVPLPPVENIPTNQGVSGLLVGLMAALVIVGGVFGYGYWTRVRK